MEVFEGNIEVLENGDLIIIDDKLVGRREFDDWISDIFTHIQDFKRIEVRLKER